MTLIEVMISQVIALVLISGVFALIVATMRSFHANNATVEAREVLRQTSHALMRDLQALGGADGRAGELLGFIDGGVGAPDSFWVFKANPGLCGGEMSSVSSPTNALGIDASSGCPFSSTTPTCLSSTLAGNYVSVSGDRGTIVAVVSSVDDTGCELTFDDTANATAIATYNASFSPAATHTALAEVFGDLSGGSAIAVRPGVRLQYRVNNEQLERRVNLESWQVVMPDVYDMQMALAYDVDNSGTIESDEWVARAVGQPTTMAGITGATNSAYLGAEVALVTFARAPDGIERQPPPSLFNRIYTSAPTGRRYRWSRNFMAARNR